MPPPDDERTAKQAAWDEHELNDQDGRRYSAFHAAWQARGAYEAGRVERLLEIASGMAACVQALDNNDAWFSRSHIALTLRDSLRTWADDFAALATVPSEQGHAAPKGEPYLRPFIDTWLAQEANLRPLSDPPAAGER